MSSVFYKYYFLRRISLNASVTVAIPLLVKSSSFLLSR